MFMPRFCPSADCPSHSGADFHYKCRGHYYRRCDGRHVQRFQCKTCGRGFSTQTFRLDYRLWKPWLLIRVFESFVSKVSHRQAARMRGCALSTVERLLVRVGDHCRDFQAQALANYEFAPTSYFQLDELETYEQNRRLSPLTVPVLIERGSWFVVSAEVGTLPSRGSLSPALAAQKAARAEIEGPRRTQSRQMVQRCFEQLAPLVKNSPCVLIGTDHKKTYPGILRATLGERVTHVRTHSRERRTTGNPLFAINHTLAMLRDGLGRLVRRTWGASKKAQRLGRHLWVWIGYRNFVRAKTNKLAPTTPAMSLGIKSCALEVSELLAARVFPWAA